MGNNLGLTHPRGLGHPVQESEVSPDVEVDEFAHEVPRPPRAGPRPTHVPFREVDPVVNGLDSEEREGEEEGDGAEDINEG